MTRFHADQKVIATDNVQGLVKGETYEVTSVNAKVTAFGDFVTYTVEPVKVPIPPMNKKVLFIQNGHLFLKAAREESERMDAATGEIFDEPIKEEA
jgi:hypothetical protein